MPSRVFLNDKRLKVYPRLVLIVEISILAFNLLFGQGWMGALKQIIGCDFIMLYSGGMLYRGNVYNLYDFQRQGEIQKELIKPAPLWGIMPFNYPPYTAMAASALTFIPLPLALGLWTLLTILAVLTACVWMHRYLTPTWLKDKGLTFAQFIILTFSFFPMIEGLQVGQNHGLTLLLLTGIIVFTLAERWYLAGILAGLTIYKPHLAIGFLILWLAWGKFKPLAGFVITTFTWVGSFIWINGFAPFQAYLSNMPLLLKMLYLEGFGGYLEVTPYGFLISVLPASWWRGIWSFVQAFTVILAIGLAVYAFLTRQESAFHKKSALILAVLFPLLSAPHVLLHDLVILVPIFLLWSDLDRSRNLLYICVSIYLAVLFLPLITHASGIALLAFIPMGVFLLQIRSIQKNWPKT